MASIFGILNIGRSGISASQQAINVTGNNIANVNTEGYTRQRVNLVATEPESAFPGQLGRGVEASDIQRVFDRYISDQINLAMNDTGQWDAAQSALEKIEMIFNETGGYGLNQALDAFWNSWQDLANHPSGHAERANLLHSAEAMATTFNQIAGNLTQVITDINNNLSGAVDDINRLSTQIDDLNQQIVNIEQGGQNANTFRDEREALLKELSEFINFSATEAPDGRVTVTLSDGNELVGNPAYGQLATASDASGMHIVWDTDGLPGIDASITGGRLRGLLDVRDQDVAGYMNQLDTLAGDLITTVNGLHTAGEDLNGNPGGAFFTGSSAMDISLSAAIAANGSLVAAAYVGGAPGGNGTAMDMATLRSSPQLMGATVTYGEYYRTLVSEVGTDVHQAGANAKHYSEIRTHLENYRESVSGVSIDEEMVNLVKYQTAYNASAKMIQTVDEMLESLIALV